MWGQTVKKKRRLLVALFVSPVVIVTVVLAILHFTRSSEFDRRVKELSEAGSPVSMADLEKRSVPKEGVENAADVYIKAFEAYVEPAESEKAFLPIRGNRFREDDSTELTDEEMDAIALSLEKNSQTLELLDQAARMDYCLFPKIRTNTALAPHFGPASLMTDYISEHKEMAQLLIERSLYLAQKREADLLFESLRTSIGQSRCLDERPFFIDYLVTQAFEAIVAASLEDGLNHVVFSDGQLSVLMREFRSMQESDVLASAMVNERAITIEFFKTPTSEQVQGWGVSGGAIFRLYSASSLKKRDALLFLDYYPDVIEASGLPPADRLERLLKIDADYKSYSAAHLVLHMNIHYRSIWKIGVRVKGQLSCAETALAIERHRLKHGELPDTLDALIGEFIDRVPVDPFDGEAVRYRKLEKNGYTLYIIGEDGVDDGGLDRKQMAEKTGEKHPESYDWPFTVRGRAN
jgi:hypothetical protein